MTHEEWKAFEDTLINRGYRKWTQAKYGEEDYDVSRLVYDEDDNDLYQIIFRFWDWTKYGDKIHTECSVDFVVVPCIDGRMDAICSSMFNGLDNVVEFAEQFAKDYYKFVIKQIEK